jgi:hypothetical protein
MATQRMTAAELIASIFSSPQHKLPGNMRRVTLDQLHYLRDLVLAEGNAREGDGGSIAWNSIDGHKYVLTEDRVGDKHSLTRLVRVPISGVRGLFD